MTPTGGDSRVDVDGATAHGRRLVRQARLVAAGVAVAAGVLVAGIGFGARAVVHDAAGDEPPAETTPTTGGGTTATTGGGTTPTTGGGTTATTGAGTTGTTGGGTGTTGSTAGQPTTVPNVIGVSQANATARLEEAGFGVQAGPGDPADPGVEPGIVIGQQPAPGTEQLTGTVVTLVVAADEVCNNGLDDDNDGAIDGADSNCSID